MRAPAMTFPALCAGILLAAACGSATKEPAATPGAAPAGEVARLDDTRYLGAAFDVGNLRVWPVHTDAPLDVGEFLTLQEAQEDGVAVVREIGGQAGGNARNLRAGTRNVRAGSANGAPAQTVQVEIEEIEVEQADGEQTDVGVRQVAQIVDVGGAQVGSLVIENKGDLPLLVCAGTIVKGGNQDRQIGQDIVVAAGETVPVDAFCVEPGRWTNVREGVANSGEFVALKAMTARNVRAKGQYEDDQGGVWEEVAVVRTRALADSGAEVASSADVAARSAQSLGTTLVDALEKVDDATKKARDDAVAAILARFAELAEGDAPPVGFAYAVNGEPQSVRVFAHDRLLRRNLESFATTMVLEAEVAPKDVFEPCTDADVVAMVELIAKDAEMHREATQAANVNVLYRNVHGFNGNCLVEDRDGKEIPVTQDWTRR